jgi:hypothetical protein
MNVWKSDLLIVPMKLGNATRADPAEGRGRRIMASFEGKMVWTPSHETISTNLERIANQASKHPERASLTRSRIGTCGTFWTSG